MNKTFIGGFLFPAVLLVLAGTVETRARTSHDGWAAIDSLPEKSPVIKRTNDDREKNRNPVTLSDFRYTENRGVLYDQPTDNDGNPIFSAVRTKPGFAFLSSAVIPGSAQLIHRNFIRGALYLMADITMAAVHFYKKDQAEEQQQHYRQYVNLNWSVARYAIWLVDYNNKNFGTNLTYDDVGEGLGGEPVPYGKDAWEHVNLSQLNELENQTRFVFSDGRVGNRFSHELPAYGSQQYYELVSKYYQFGPGWNDFGFNRNGEKIDDKYQLAWDGSDMSFRFFHGAELAENFNSNFRVANNMLKFMILNHMISAFDGFFTVKLSNNSMRAKASILNNGGLLTLNYRF